MFLSGFQEQHSSSLEEMRRAGHESLSIIVEEFKVSAPLILCPANTEHTGKTQGERAAPVTALKSGSPRVQERKGRQSPGLLSPVPSTVTRSAIARSIDGLSDAGTDMSPLT